MSDDLISRKAVLNILTEARVKDSILCSPAFIEILTQRIKKIPTAFDKEKVMDELKSAENYFYVNGIRITNFKFIHTLTAIEIVEKGGIND